ncbi:hypothetical protein C1646_754899 [Rhizophagus diaphanus]|nr:hypothetical protein C1646_754899 [Rhizophagus diaphanus] [Rhizophagus sp. MUCL 43196]
MSLESEGLESACIFPQKKKNFNNIISRGKISAFTAVEKNQMSETEIGGGGLGSSIVNKDRPTSSGFEEIPKVRLEKEKEKVVFGNEKKVEISKRDEIR